MNRFHTIHLLLVTVAFEDRVRRLEVQRVDVVPAPAVDEFRPSSTQCASVTGVAMVCQLVVVKLQD